MHPAKARSTGTSEMSPNRIDLLILWSVEWPCRLVSVTTKHMGSTGRSQGDASSRGAWGGRALDRLQELIRQQQRRTPRNLTPFTASAQYHTVGEPPDSRDRIAPGRPESTEAL